MKTWIRIPVLVLFTVLLAGAALGQEVAFKDPTGDDKGPGTYVYPTDKVYTAGSFDLTEFKMKVSGGKAEFSVSVNTKLEDLASSITVMTKNQMSDFAMLDLNDVFLYVAGTEGSGTYTDVTLDRNGSVSDNV